MRYQFYKYQGAGNDFVVIDNREGGFDGNNAPLIEFLCHRRFGIGADGLMTLENAEGYDFKMSYYNSDGYEASMCGNGGRCIVAFARKLNLIGNKAVFLAADGSHEASIDDNNEVNLQMIDVDSIAQYADGYFLNTGVPHLVHFVDDLHVVDVEIEGRQLRYDARFQPEGCNVNFVKQDGKHLTVYTYERGVECETLACGTGITASALSSALRDGIDKGSYQISAKGGELEVSFERKGDLFTNVWLKGPAELVYEGFIDARGFEEIMP
ncbi:diaminopimelate epimerase [Roseimarinus sediminis]|uniref:diaminopimelate epimerase n=1 Tax=Roseimarinus sediminis TaxID=1610899 RepID=UPI003D1DC59E